MAELVKQAGASGPTLKNFLDTLAENNRLGLLNGVIEKFGQIISAARGEVEMTVTSAQVCFPIFRGLCLLGYFEKPQRRHFSCKRTDTLRGSDFANSSFAS